MSKKSLRNDYYIALSEFFTDLEHLRNQFKRVVSEQTLVKHIFVIHGIGGVGKSSLLEMFLLHCKNINIPVALTSGDETKSPVDILSNWKDDLREDGILLPTFTKTLNHFRSIQAKAEDKAKNIIEKLAESAVTTIAETALSTIPVVGPLLSKFGGASVDAISDWLRIQEFSETDIDLFNNPLKRLTNDFLIDIENIVESHRIVLIFDTFEKMTGHEKWMCDLAKDLHKKNLFLVIAGRGVPKWDRWWKGWLAEAYVEEIELMDPNVMRELAQNYYYKLTHSKLDIQQIEEIIKFARGFPIVITSAIDLMVKYQAKKFPAISPIVINDLAKRLQEDVPEETKISLQAAAAVRWFNEPILRAIMQKTDVSKDYEEIINLSFIVIRDGQFALHEVVRDTLDASLLARDLDHHRELHNRAAQYFENLINNSRFLPGISEDWQKLTEEAVYHLLQADEDAGLDLLSKLFELGIQYLRYQYCHNLLDDAESLKLTNPKTKHRLKHFCIRLTATELSWAYIDEHDLIDLIKESDFDPETRWDVYLSYAWFLGFAGKHDEARGYYEKSIKELQAIGKEESAAGCLVLTSLASAYGRSGFVKELAQRAIEISNKIGAPLLGYEAYTELGHAYFSQANYRQSEELWKRALEIAKEYRNDMRIADAQNKLAQALILLENYSEAEIILNSAMQSASNLPDTLGGKQDKEMYINRHLGLLYQAKGELENAIQYLSESANTYRQRRSTNGLFRTLVLLADCYYEANRHTDLKDLSNEIDIVATRSGMGDWIARWQVLKGNILLDEVTENGELLDQTIDLYKMALLSALDWNVQTLDFIVQRICWKLNQLAISGKTQISQLIVERLTKFWKTEHINGVSIHMVEHEKRKQFRIISGFDTKLTVVKQIKSINSMNYKPAKFSIWDGL